jgi:hypothetical protein
VKFNSVLSGCALFKNREIPLFAFEPPGEPDNSFFAVLLDTQWHGFATEPAWTVIGMGCAKYPSAADWIIIASSSEGHLWELTPGPPIERELRIPGNYSGLTKLASIENAVWACGMGRVVLKRKSDGTWVDLSAPQPSVEAGVIGFTALTGSAPGEIAAVGWKGEIWWRRNDKWEAQESGTNANFNAVSAAEDGQIVVVGDGGSVVVGRKDQWATLDVGVDFNLQGVCHFGGEVFISSDFKLFRLEHGMLVEETRYVGGDAPATCMNLILGPESVFSQGENDIFRYSKGMWTRLI